MEVHDRGDAREAADRRRSGSERMQQIDVRQARQVPLLTEHPLRPAARAHGHGHLLVGAEVLVTRGGTNRLAGHGTFTISFITVFFTLNAGRKGTLTLTEPG